MKPSPDPANPDPDDLEAEVRQAYLAHAPTVHRHALRAALGDHAAAEDATQEAFMQAVRTWPEFRLRTSEKQRAWLCTTARNRVIDSWRVTCRALPTDSLPDQPEPRSLEDTVVSDITLDRFWKVITTAVLPRAARAAYLRWHEEWTMIGIANHLGIDRATVLRDLNQVLEATRQLGDETGLPVSSEGKET